MKWQTIQVLKPVSKYLRKQNVTFAAFHHCKTPSDDFKIRTCKADCLVSFKKDKIKNTSIIIIIIIIIIQ